MAMHYKQHRCAAVDCQKQIPTHLLMCLRHWRDVPKPLQSAIWATYVKGQEAELSKVTASYLKNVEEAIKVVATKEGKQVPAKYQDKPAPETPVS